MASVTGRKFVRYALNIGAMELTPEGRKLKSGRMSPYFFNAGLFNGGHSLVELAKAYAAPINKFFPQVVFGPAYKGIPIAAVVVEAIFRDFGHDVWYSFNRKEAKDHAEGGILVGASLSGRRVAIVDDVMTKGASGDTAVEIVRSHGGAPIVYVIAFDRMEKIDDESSLSATQEFSKKHGIPVVVAADLDDLINELKVGGSPKELETLVHIMHYRERYGV